MKLKNLIACFFLGFIMVSCIQDEAPNAEADIETCTVPGDVLNRDPIIGNDQITLPLKKGANISKLAPEFTLTPGATINPESGVVRDFSTPQKYVVTSEDGKWKKEYEVCYPQSAQLQLSDRCAIVGMADERADPGGTLTVFGRPVTRLRPLTSI